MFIKSRFIVILFALSLALGLASGLFAQDAEWYLGKPIGKIEFNGLRSVRLADLEGITSPYIGRIFSDDVFAELQGRLYSLEYFETISPQAEPMGLVLGSEVLLRFTVTERPHVSQILFEGNTGLTRSELMDAVTIKVNDVANEMRIRLDEQAIILRYQDKGYPDVSVSSATRPAARGNGVVLVFTVNEGQHTVIEAIRFEGNSVFSAKTLLGKISLKEKKGLRSGAFSEAKLLSDRQTINTYYQERGFIDATVEDVGRESRHDDKGNNLLTLTFRINEGRLWTFGGITFRGNEIFSSEELAALVRTKIGAAVNANLLEADIQRIADRYYENGYIFNSIARQEVRDEAQGTLSYVMAIEERGRAHIEHITVRGNTKTKDHVILREIPLEPGDVFSKAKVQEGIRNLYNLRFFGTSIAPDMQTGSADQLMDLIINVEEQPTTDVNFGLTFSGTSDPDAFPISGMLSLTNRNFLGSGNSLGGEANVSPTTQSGSIRYTQQWLFGLPLSGGFDFTVSHTQNTAFIDNLYPWFNGDEDYAYPDGFDSLSSYQNSYSTTSDYLMKYEVLNFSLGFSTGYRWTTPLGNLSLGGGIRTGAVVNSFDEELYRPFDPKLRNKNNIWIPTNSIWTSLSLDQRDIYYDPNKGYYISQRFGIYGMLPGELENEHYIKTDTKAEIFFTLWNWDVSDSWYFRGVLGFHSGLSFLLPQPGYNAPVAETASKVSVDGWFIGRGWVSERRNTGLALWENWAELRVPILPGFLAWDFFFDAAAVASKPEYIFGIDPTIVDEKGGLLERMRFSMGFGFRFALPQFPFRFLFAKRFKVVDGQVEWQQGGLFGPLSMDFVLSFALSSY